MGSRALRGFGAVVAPVLFLAWCSSKSPTPTPAGPPQAGGCARASTNLPASVLFEESFADGCLSKRGWYDNTSLLISSAEHAPGSASSAQFHFLAGATSPTSGGAIRHKFTPSSSVDISFDVKYSDNWVGSAHTYHPHEFYVLSSMDGDYDGLSNDWLTLYVEHNYQNGGKPRMALQDNKEINTTLGALPISLITLTENRSVGGCNGILETNIVTECYDAPPWYNDAKLTGPVTFQPGTGPGYKGNWNHVEAYFQLNSIANGVERSDGVMQYWFNDSLVIDRHDIVFRTGERPSLQLNQFVIAPYIGDGSPVDQSMWVDNLIVATAPAGVTQQRNHRP